MEVALAFLSSEIASYAFASHFEQVANVQSVYLHYSVLIGRRRQPPPIGAQGRNRSAVRRTAHILQVLSACIPYFRSWTSKLLASYGLDGEIRIRDPLSGWELQRLSSHAGSVLDVAFGVDRLLHAAGVCDISQTLMASKLPESPIVGDDVDRSLTGHRYMGPRSDLRTIRSEQPLPDGPAFITTDLLEGLWYNQRCSAGKQLFGGVVDRFIFQGFASPSNF